MDTDQIANLAYLGVLACVLVLWYVIQNRGGLTKMFQHLAAWVFIFLGAIAVFGLWDDISATLSPRQSVFADEGRIELPRSEDGHYYVTLVINDQPVRFVVDTGATAMVLTQDDAARVGLKGADLVYLSEAMTANGPVRTAPVRLDTVALGPFQDAQVPAYVNGGQMDGSLLGMTYLDMWQIQIANGTMVLER